MIAQVRSFMLSTGQEIIAELVKPTAVGHIIKNPLVVHMMRGPDGKPKWQAVTWFCRMVASACAKCSN